MLELMARAGMRISEVLNLTPDDIDERKLILQKPKSGIRGEVVYIPSKLQRRLNRRISGTMILEPRTGFFRSLTAHHGPWLRMLAR